MSLGTVLKKTASIERCIARAREDYGDDPDRFAEDYTIQDAIVLNLLRACEQTIDVAQVAVRSLGLPRPDSNKDLFAVLERAGVIAPPLAQSLSSMVGFRNIAVHDYQEMDIAIAKRVVETEVDQLLEFAVIIARRLEDG